MSHAPNIWTCVAPADARVIHPFEASTLASSDSSAVRCSPAGSLRGVAAPATRRRWADSGDRFGRSQLSSRCGAQTRLRAYQDHPEALRLAARPTRLPGTSLVAIAGSEAPGFRAHLQHSLPLSRVLDVPRLSAPVIKA